MTTPGPTRSRSWLFWGLLSLILAALPAAYFFLLEREPPPVTRAPVPAIAPVSGPVELKLVEVEGTVEVRHAQGEWAAAELNTVLRASDGVRTRDGARAVLSGGDAYDVRLEPGTDVSVDTLTDSISKLMLGSGMATARVRSKDKHAFEVRAANSDAVARTQGGTFAISSNGAGTVAVGTREGEVEFLGSGKVVIVRPGQQSVARPGEAPTDPVQVPGSLLMKVQWPASNALRKRTLVIKGQTEPGTWVEVGGAVTRVGADGAFSTTLQLREGSNDVKVRARAVGGASEEQQQRVSVDTTPPKVGIDPNLWK